MPEVMQISDETRANSGFRASLPERSFHPRKLLTMGARLTNAVIELVFPAACAGCGRVDRVWCARCQSQLEAIPILQISQQLQGDVRTLPLVSTGWHTGLLQTAVQALKYENLPQLALPLGDRLAAVLAHHEWPVDMVMPVPLHAERLRSRGYNQAGLLAQALSDITGIPCDTTALHRRRDTRSQVGLNRGERLENMSEAFYADARAGATVLLLDDVATTGATLQACADALYASGVSMVYAMTVSAALGHRNPTDALNDADLAAGDQYTFDNREL